jgi:hypothetical protein
VVSGKRFTPRSVLACMLIFPQKLRGCATCEERWNPTLLHHNGV